MTPADRARPWAALVFAIYLALLVVSFVLVPRPIDEGLTPWIRGLLAGMSRYVPGRIDYEFTELASHVALFVPLGILAVVAVGRRMAWLAVLVVVGVGVLVEYGPTMLGSDHSPSRLDLLMNGVGAVIGAAVGYWALPLSGAGPRSTG
jgi:glycopeptide antibiotics resistance protein